MGHVEVEDPTTPVAELASERTGRKCGGLCFDEMEFEEVFDWIWASASLLHVPRAELDVAFRRLLRAAKSLGVVSVSFKYGTKERMKEGRLFVDFTEDTLSSFVGQFPEAEILRDWQTTDVRPGRSAESWVNALMCKVGR